MSFFFGKYEEPEFDQLENMVSTIQLALQRVWPQESLLIHEDLFLFGLDNAVRALRAGVDPEAAVIKAFSELKQKQHEVRQ